MEYSTIKAVPENYVTPCYVFDLDKLQERMELTQSLLGDRITVCYAMKANPFVVGAMNTYTSKYEVCSPGEYEICHREGIPPSKIVVSGVNKTEESIHRIMELSHGQGIFTIESEEHYRILSKVCNEQGTQIKVLLRLSSGNQFGMDKEHLEKVLLQVIADCHMELEGLHYYSGTQKKPKKVEKELAALQEYAVYLKETYGVRLKELEYGPGLAVTYFQNEEPLDVKQQLEELRTQLEQVSEFENITIEMGRFLASDCGYYYTRVMDTKTSNGINYAIVDGGIHQLNFYGQMMGMKVPHMRYLPQEKMQTEVEESWTICGSLCTVNDVIVKGAMLPKPKKGDCLVFEKCGAYSVTEGMALFLSRELPQVMFYTNENGFTIARELTEINIMNTRR